MWQFVLLQMGAMIGKKNPSNHLTINGDTVDIGRRENILKISKMKDEMSKMNDEETHLKAIR